MTYGTLTLSSSTVRTTSRLAPSGPSDSRRGGRKSPRVTRLLRSKATAVARILSPACYSVSIFGSGADYAGC